MAAFFYWGNNSVATTRLMPIHISKGKNAAQSLSARLNYAENPEKTMEGALVSSYACDPKTAANEFDLMRKTYLQQTGRYREGEVIAYQLRQSFKPGEVTPEEANQIGYELARRFLKGNHAFIVATHTDKPHIHNHIIFCATDLECLHKFRNFLGSGKALARLSDQICMERKLSVVEDPKYRDSNYDRWLGEKAKPTSRDMLRLAIDEMLQKKPDGFAALMKMLEEAGWEIKHGKQLSFRAPGGKRFLRLDTLGEDYSEKALREVLEGKRTHNPRQTRRMKQRGQISLLIDIQAKMQQGKGKGYENWAKVFNLKQMASSMAYLSSHNIRTYEELCKIVDDAVKKNDELLDRVRSAEARLKEIAELKKAITNYLKTKDVYAEWKKSGYYQTFYADHESEIIIHKAAKKVFDSIEGKIPRIKDLTAEYSEILAQKQKDYAAYRESKTEMRELLNVKANIDIVTERNPRSQDRFIER